MGGKKMKDLEEVKKIKERFERGEITAEQIDPKTQEKIAFLMKQEIETSLKEIEENEKEIKETEKRIEQHKEDIKKLDEETEKYEKEIAEIKKAIETVNGYLNDSDK